MKKTDELDVTPVRKFLCTLITHSGFWINLFDDCAYIHPEKQLYQ